VAEKLVPQSVNQGPGIQTQDLTPHDSKTQTAPDRALMAYLRARWGAWIAEACRVSSIPPSFLAALIANESGGKEGARRFEPQVFAKLKGVRNGKNRGRPPLERRQLAGADEEALSRLATSYGLTQIMGYHVLEDRGQGTEGSTTTDPHRLLDPRFNLQKALRMLAAFCTSFDLDPRAEFVQMFRCWNTGRPDGKTFDPQYVERGIRRMKLYQETEAGGRFDE
jgi:hypothetical protein